MLQFLLGTEEWAFINEYSTFFTWLKQKSRKNILLKETNKDTHAETWPDSLCGHAERPCHRHHQHSHHSPPLQSTRQWPGWWQRCAHHGRCASRAQIRRRGEWGWRPRWWRWQPGEVSEPSRSSPLPAPPAADRCTCQQNAHQYSPVHTAHHSHPCPHLYYTCLQKTQLLPHCHPCFQNTTSTPDYRMHIYYTRLQNTFPHNTVILVHRTHLYYTCLQKIQLLHHYHHCLQNTNSTPVYRTHTYYTCLQDIPLTILV